MTDDLRVALIACKRILARLQTLSDAPTGHIRTDGIMDHAIGTGRLRSRETHPLPVKGHGYRETQIPEGVSLNDTVRGEHAPSKRLSLWAHYQFRIQNAAKEQNATKLLGLAWAATRDYETYTGQRRASVHEHHGEAVRELLRDYAGYASNEAAVWLETTEKWVRRQRVLHGRDPDLGEERQENVRTDRIVRMAKAGASTRAIATEVGLSAMQVSRVLNGG